MQGDVTASGDGQDPVASGAAAPGPAPRRLARMAALRRRKAMRIAVIGGTAAAVVLGTTAGLLLSSDDEPLAVTSAPLAVAPSPEPSPTPTPKPACSTAKRSFVPTAIKVAGISEKITVLPLRRDAFGVPGVPPLTSGGKFDMAFDLGSGIKPGDKRGNVLLNAHTWPDGSALGNKLLGTLRKGDEIVVRGPLGRICYRVNDRVQVPFDDPGKRFYQTKGKPQIAIIVCSGERTAPGHWTKRTIWYASPVD